MQNTFTIRGHKYPEMAKVRLLDDIEKVYYQPIGGNIYHEVIYIKCPYPISHTCAIEQEREDVQMDKRFIY